MAAVNKKNGLIELFRFLCSIWVAYFHGFFPYLPCKNIFLQYILIHKGLIHNRTNVTFLIFLIHSGYETEI